VYVYSDAFDDETKIMIHLAVRVADVRVFVIRF
jgi:hypothetical protein